jgi:nucleoside-diphosphate-sugar epimerase
VVVGGATARRPAVRVVVLGGTGFIGRRVVERLVSRGDDVLVVHRGVTEPSG